MQTIESKNRLKNEDDSHVDLINLMMITEVSFIYFWVVAMFDPFSMLDELKNFGNLFIDATSISVLGRKETHQFCFTGRQEGSQMAPK